MPLHAPKFENAGGGWRAAIAATINAIAAHEYVCVTIWRVPNVSRISRIIRKYAPMAIAPATASAQPSISCPAIGGRAVLKPATKYTPAPPATIAHHAALESGCLRAMESYSAVQTGVVATSNVDIATLVYSSDQIHVAKCAARATPATTSRLSRRRIDAGWDRRGKTAEIAHNTAAAIESRRADTASGDAPDNAKRAKIAAAPTASCAAARTVYRSGRDWSVYVPDLLRANACRQNCRPAAANTSAITTVR